MQIRTMDQARMRQKQVGAFPLFVRPIGSSGKSRRVENQSDYERAVRWAIRTSPKGMALITKSGRDFP